MSSLNTPPTIAASSGAIGTVPEEETIVLRVSQQPPQIRWGQSRSRVYVTAIPTVPNDPPHAPLGSSSQTGGPGGNGGSGYHRKTAHATDGDVSTSSCPSCYFLTSHEDATTGAVNMARRSALPPAALGSPEAGMPSQSSVARIISIRLSDAQYLELELFASFLREGSSAKFLDNGHLVISLVKEKLEIWPRLALTLRKLHFVGVDWEKCEDAVGTDSVSTKDDGATENEERLSAAAPAASGAPMRMLSRMKETDQGGGVEVAPSSSEIEASSEPFSTVRLPDGRLVQIPILTPLGLNDPSSAIAICAQDCREVEKHSVPPLQDFTAEQGQANKGLVVPQTGPPASKGADEEPEDLSNMARITTFWLEDLTMLQRLHTLTQMWNALRIDERAEALRTLTGLMDAIDPHIASHIKGGEEVLSDLEAGEYMLRHVTYVKLWVQQLTELPDTAHRLLVLVRLFQFMSPYEQKVICSTFV